jgi:hypothetical protein
MAAAMRVDDAVGAQVASGLAAQRLIENPRVKIVNVLWLTLPPAAWAKLFADVA